MTQHILRIDASARRTGSVSRDLADKIIDRIGADATVTTRDLADGMSLIDEAWVGANFTPEDDRTDEQREKLALSDTLVAEIKAADTLVIGLPIYNFGVPAALKAWVDQVARAGVTFRYSEYGPKGLLEGKRAIVAVASGGTEAGSDIDFASGYIRHVLGFIGITDVEFVTADRLMMDADGTMMDLRRAFTLSAPEGRDLLTGDVTEVLVNCE
jgi:FMN-dependent NADH-azoreductase